MISVKDLTYTYPSSQHQTLRGLNIDIARGEIFGFLGPSGSGKSTTQNILIGKLRQYGGSVRVFGEEMRRIGNGYYERIGVAFEFPHFYNRFTALENLTHFGLLYRKRVSEPMALLEQVGLREAAHKKVEHFSKGMKMRLNFCRAVLHDPELLFLDEPTSGLDPAHADTLKRLIESRRAAGATVLLTTHNMQVAEQLCDRVAFIADGQIQMIDTPRNLKLRLGERKVRVEYESGEAQLTEDFQLEGIGSNERYLTLIRTHRIVTMHTLEASLEDLFQTTIGCGES
ncbi:ABC transporter ATP-binding protein [Paenibacillus sp. 1P07SE]|uniref:ABC transporter ATP-binding protein n=1 Tax=Paenibacillus sp. 1P07SE TaxID=3132209 RepID=UPI0039A44615